MSWVPTHSGVKFELLNPQPEMIKANDIALSLSRTARFNGHTKNFYSVAQHCVIMSNTWPKYEMACLLHDAAETYIGDCVRPLKQLLPMFSSIESSILNAIERRFGLVEGWLSSLDEIKHYDRVMLATERRDLMLSTSHEWPDLADPLELEICPVPCGIAYDMFCDRFAEVFGCHPKSWDVLHARQEFARA